MVEEIEKFRAELNEGSFSEGEREILDHGKIGIHEARSVQWRPRRVPEFAGRRVRERAGVEPILQSVNLRRAVGAVHPRDHPRSDCPLR